MSKNVMDLFKSPIKLELSTDTSSNQYTDRACQVPGCYRPFQAKGYCKVHYARWRRNGDPGSDIELRPKGKKPKDGCDVQGCENSHYSSGFCSGHYQRLNDNKPIDDTPLQVRLFKNRNDAINKVGEYLCFSCLDYRSEDNFSKYTDEKVRSDCNDCRKYERYGLNRKDIQNLIDKQNNCCALCLSSFLKRRMAVDHCHKTNKVRGLLCYRCNTALGSFEDDPAILQKAISYLEGGGFNS